MYVPGAPGAAGIDRGLEESPDCYAPSGFELRSDRNIFGFDPNWIIEPIRSENRIPTDTARAFVDAIEKGERERKDSQLAILRGLVTFQSLAETGARNRMTKETKVNMSTNTAAALQEWEVKEPYIKLHCALGEGPYYEKATNSLRFVDIIKKRVHTVDLSKGPESLTTLEFDTPIGVTADIEGVDPHESILIGAKHGIAVLHRKTGKYEYITKFFAEENVRIRGNDGAIDPHGRFWLGSMTDFGQGPVQPEDVVGALWLFHSKKPSQSMKGPVSIPNSVSWSPDNKVMYFTHSSSRVIHAFDYASEDGSISNERVFFTYEGQGEPDGHRIDVEGNMWCAVYGDSVVLKISPEGKLIGKIHMPTKSITCVEFVGTELFITTAGLEEGQGTPEQVDLSGALFRIDVGVKGLEPYLFKLAA
ncbi:calcium homeostasis protein [Seiridium cupressi]